MMARIAFLLFLIVVLAGFAASGKNEGSVAETPEIRITTPPPDLPPKVVALSGIWEATQAGLGPTRVAVERINETWASMLQFWPEAPTGYSHSGWRRVRARVLPTGELMWGYPARFTLRIAADGNTLESRIERAGATTTTILKRLGAS